MLNNFPDPKHAALNTQLHRSINSLLRSVPFHPFCYTLRSLALELHPDKAQAPLSKEAASGLFARAHASYKQLASETRRAEYDATYGLLQAILSDAE